MRRRDFITLLGGAAASLPLAARAQQHERVRRLGVLMSVEEGDAEGKAQLSGFTQALAQLGWTDGQNLRMEIRWGTHLRQRVGRPAARRNPRRDSGHRGTSTGNADNPHCICCSDRSGRGRIRCRTIASGRELTGFLTSEAGITAKMLELLREIAPGLKRVAMLFNPDTEHAGGGKYYFSEFEAAARSSNVEPIAARAHSDAEIENVVNSLGGEPGGGLIVMPDYFMVIHVKPILLLAARDKVPAIYPWRFVVARDSALLSYGPTSRGPFVAAPPTSTE